MILPPAVKNDQNYTSCKILPLAVKKVSVFIKNDTEGALLEKMHQGPWTLKPPLDS
jgi:hypothetical protein